MARGQTKRAIHRPASGGDTVRETSGEQGTGIAIRCHAITDAKPAPMQAGGAANALHGAAIRRRVISARQQIKAQADIRRRFPPAQRVAFFQKCREFGGKCLFRGAVCREHHAGKPWVRAHPRHAASHFRDAAGLIQGIQITQQTARGGHCPGRRRIQKGERAWLRPPGSAIKRKAG